MTADTDKLFFGTIGIAVVGIVWLSSLLITILSTAAEVRPAYRFFPRHPWRTGSEPAYRLEEPTTGASMFTRFVGNRRAFADCQSALPTDRSKQFQEDARRTKVPCLSEREKNRRLGQSLRTAHDQFGFKITSVW